MPRGDGTGPMGLGPGCRGPRAAGGLAVGLSMGSGLARFGEPVPNADALERQAAVLERQAAAYRAMADAVKTVDKKDG